MSILIRIVNSEVDEFAKKLLEVIVKHTGEGSEDDVIELRNDLRRFLENYND